jgi:hypothetical protein
MHATLCHVCGKRTDPEAAHARLTLRGEHFLVCCPMCLTALEAGSVLYRLMPPSHSGRHADVRVRYPPSLLVGGDFAVVDLRGAALAVGDVPGHGVTAALLSRRCAWGSEATGKGRAMARVETANRPKARLE